VLANTDGKFTQAAAIVSSSGDISRSVDDDINGIGFVTFGNRCEAKEITISGSCGLLFTATEFAIKTEDYALARRLSAYTIDSSMSEIAGDFIAYLDTADVQNVVELEGYVSAEITTEHADQQGFRFAMLF
jgi:phosphate transport system substrate-binding protein